MYHAMYHMNLQVWVHLLYIIAPGLGNCEPPLLVLYMITKLQ